MLIIDILLGCVDFSQGCAPRIKGTSGNLNSYHGTDIFLGQWCFLGTSGLWFVFLLLILQCPVVGSALLINAYVSSGILTATTIPLTSGWPSGLRRCVQVAVHFCGREFESPFWHKYFLGVNQNRWEGEQTWWLLGRRPLLGLIFWFISALFFDQLIFCIYTWSSHSCGNMTLIKVADPDVIWTRSLLIWSQTRYRCATESSSMWSSFGFSTGQGDSPLTENVGNKQQSRKTLQCVHFDRIKQVKNILSKNHRV